MLNKNQLLFFLVYLLLFISSTALQANESTIFFYSGSRGSPILATDKNGEVLWRENYTPFGERRVKSSSSSDNHNWFANKLYNDDSGLSYFNARYYSPALGKFMSIDPVDPNEGNVHSFNRYAYANNNPYKFIDPDVRIPVDTLLDVSTFDGVDQCHELILYQQEQIVYLQGQVETLRKQLQGIAFAQ